MNAAMAEAINDGKTYASFLRVSLNDGRVIVRRPETVFTRDEDGAVMRASVFLTPDDLDGCIVTRVGLTYAEDGEEIAGGGCASVGNGGLGVTASCSVRVDIKGQTSDRLGRILTGLDALCEFGIRAEYADGTAVGAFAEAECTQNGLTVRATLPKGARVLTVIVDGEDALVLTPQATTENVDIEVTSTEIDTEAWTEQDAVALNSITLEGQPIRFSTKTLPLRISPIAEKLAERYNGRLSAFDKYLVVRADNAIRVFLGDDAITERAAHDVKSEWVSEDGMLAYSAGGKVRLCKGLTDYFVKDIAADLVAITGSGAQAVVHCLDTVGGKCTGLDANGEEVYTRASNEIGLGTSYGRVMTIDQTQMYLYEPEGRRILTRSLLYIVRKVYRCMPDCMLVEAGQQTATTRMLVSLKVTYLPDQFNDVTDACNRLFCEHDGSSYKLGIIRVQRGEQIAEICGGEIAYTDALYVRGDEGVFRYRPLECGTIAYSSDISPGDALVCNFDRYVKEEGDQLIAVNIDAKEV